MAQKETNMVAEVIKPKRRRLYLMSRTNTNPKNLLMNTPDEILYNILSRLSAKPLMRLKCVSTYLNRQITHSYFKSRRKVLFSDPYLNALDDKNVYSRVDLPIRFQNYQDWEYHTFVVGTLNGIVILVQQINYDLQVILYNPLTGEVKKLPDPPRPCCVYSRNRCPCAYGFGYGYEANPNDSKIVIGYTKCTTSCINYNFLDKNRSKRCHVFSLKTRSWTTPKTEFFRGAFREDVGVFLNGYLHWITLYPKLEIVILDVEKMKVSRMDVPDGSDDQWSRLSTLDKCLCMINKRHSGFDVWVVAMKTGCWSKRYSFTLGIDQLDYKYLYGICILEDGRIVVMDSKSHHFIFYDPYKGSHDVFKYGVIVPFATCIEYVEIAPSSDPLDISYF